MAYNKKTWKARQGLGLNKFSIDGATPVPIINQPDSVTQQGDALSAGNLNDLEQRIADAFDDVEESKADKSTTDALQSQINQHESRLENLEQKAGDYTTVQYRGTDAVPTGKAKNGLVEKIVGKTRAWNQMARELGSTYWQFNNATGSFSDGVATFTASANRGSLTMSNAGKTLPSVANKTIMIMVDVKTTSATTSVRLYAYGGYIIKNCVSSTGWQTISIIFTTNASWGTDLTNNNRASIEDDRTGSWDAVQVRNWRIRDLSIILPEYTSAQLEALGVSGVLSLLPSLGQYNAYDAGSLVSTAVSGVKSEGVNIFDGQLEEGEYNPTTGEKVPSTLYLRNVNLIPVLPNTTYYLKSPLAFSAYYFDINAQKIGTGSPTLTKDHSFTTDASAYYMAFAFNKANYGGLPYKHDIQICLDSYADKTTFHEYMTDTLSLSETVTLRSAGSVADELDVESGVITRNVAEVDLGDYSWIYAGTDSEGLYRWEIANLITSKVLVGVCSKYLFNATTNHTVGVEEMLWHGSSKNLLFFTTTNYNAPSDVKTAMNGVKLCYVPTTEPTTESIDPTPDNTLYTEGGGTIDTIQEQTPVIDNCLDVGYLTL